MYLFTTRKHITTVIAIIIIAILIIPHPVYAAKHKKVKNIKIKNVPDSVKVIKKGKKFKLKVSASPKKARKSLTFKSNNKKVVSVSKKGVVKAKKKGAAFVTTFAKGYSGKKKKTKIIVGEPVKRIQITGDNIVMPKKKLKLKAKIYPYNATYDEVEWKSSNPKIATVSKKGKVTYKRDGNVIITAISKDGSNIKKSFSIQATTLKANDTFFIAHRGLCSVAPENSVAAFDLAGQNGFSGVECDIWEVKKNKKNNSDFIVFHDTTLNRMTGRSGYVYDYKFEELTNMNIISGNGLTQYGNEKVPSLDNYLATIKNYPGVSPIIEIKSLTTTNGAIKIVDKLNASGLKKNTHIISFQRDALEKIKAVDSTIKTMLLTATGTSLEEQIRWAKKNGIEVISFYGGALSKKIVSDVHTNGLKVGVYTINNEVSAYKYIKQMGVDYLTSDCKLFY